MSTQLPFQTAGHWTAVTQGNQFQRDFLHEMMMSTVSLATVSSHLQQGSAIRTFLQCSQLQTGEQELSTYWASTAVRNRNRKGKNTNKKNLTKRRRGMSTTTHTADKTAPCRFTVTASFYWTTVANAPNVQQPYWFSVLNLDVPDLTASLLL